MIFDKAQGTLGNVTKDRQGWLAPALKKTKQIKDDDRKKGYYLFQVIRKRSLFSHVSNNVVGAVKDREDSLCFLINRNKWLRVMKNVIFFLLVEIYDPPFIIQNCDPWAALNPIF